MAYLLASQSRSQGDDPFGSKEAAGGRAVVWFRDHEFGAYVHCSFLLRGPYFWSA